MIDQILAYWPLLLVAAGVAVLLYGQRDRLAALWTWLWGFWPSPDPTPPPDPRPLPLEELTPGQRFEHFYRLRLWCSTAGRMKAVEALDQSVLPAIVKGGDEP